MWAWRGPSGGEGTASGSSSSLRSGISSSNRDEFFKAYVDLGKFHPLTVDFFAVDADFGRCGDAEPDLVSIHGQNRDGEAV